tara:strand:- start:317 stop:1402 length:1086 start_codon:yes stop_codon:yes gene_type:complete
MIEPKHPFAGLSIAHDYINLATPDSWTKFNLAMSQGFGDMWLKQGVDWFDFEFFQQENRWNPIIEEENWNDTHSSYREGITHREDMTEGQALSLAEAHDRDAFFGFWFKNVGAWDGYRIGGYLVGSLPDPINFIPLGGGITHLVRAGNTAYKAMKSMRFGGLVADPARMIGRVSQEGVEASIYAGLATSVIYHKKNVFEQEYGFSDVGMDMAFAFGAGFAIGNFARAGRTFKNWSAGRQQGTIIEQANRLENGQHPTGGPVDPNRPDGPEDLTPSDDLNLVDPEEVARIEAQRNRLDAEANAPDNQINIDNAVNSILEDRSIRLGWDTFVNTLDNLRERLPEFIDMMVSCVNGRGVGGRRT